MAQEIVLYHSAQTGAPSGVLNALGALIAVLDACLVNGFNSQSVTGITQTGGVATATTAGTNGYSIGEWVENAGAAQAGYNGRVKVLSKPAANQFTFAVLGGTVSPATGAITTKYPAAGWSKTAAGTNIAAYQGGAGSLGLWMQVEDNNPYADANVGVRTRMAQGWTGLDSATVLGTQINIAKQTGGWMLFADSKTCYLLMGSITTAAALLSFHFGELSPFYAGDAFPMFQNFGRNSTSIGIVDEATANYGVDRGGSYFPFLFGVGGDAGGALVSAQMLRGISQIGGPVPCNALFARDNYRSNGGVNWVAHNQFIALPNLADNAIPLSPMFAYEWSSPAFTLRGRFRGMHWPLGRLPSGFVNSFQRLDNAIVDGVAQSVVLVNVNGIGGRQLAFQVDGSWG